MSEFKRSVLSESESQKVVDALQRCLVDLIDLSLLLKQAHWCVVGSQFRAVHLQLDEILNDVRLGSDEIAERISTLGLPPDGRSKTIAEKSTLPAMDLAFTSAGNTVSQVADCLHQALRVLREGVNALGELDPVSQDLLIGITAGLEKHLWMVQSQEL
ncbi:MAG: DNA starvation/stationary phase protection protein [Planctomycetaceae bacterium]|nr:DNA starvation/stationary phase protection protein [Planctomycetaceae bacterium]